MPRAQQVLFVGIVLAAQIAFSHWWVARYRYGPMEWLWRGFTYRQLPRLAPHGRAWCVRLPRGVKKKLTQRAPEKLPASERFRGAECGSQWSRRLADPGLQK